MNILVVGSGGREHALAQAYARSRKVQKVYVAPGNGLVDVNSKKIFSLPNVRVNDIAAIVHVVKTHAINLVDIAMDEPIALGFVNTLREQGIAAFGPTKEAAEIEWNKVWARSFMSKYGLPIPRVKSFSEPSSAKQYVKALPEQVLYIKASGLAGGKGAVRANTKEEAYKAIEFMSQFGEAGKTFVIEECMIGEEFSLFALCDGKNYQIIGTAQDHKTVNNRDQGLNTGGMGCVSPTLVVNSSIIQQVKKTILTPFMKAMRSENRAYTGILYLGAMLTKDGVKIVEFNARWGDPEAQVIVPGIQTDYLKLVEYALAQKLSILKLQKDTYTRVSIAVASPQYPASSSASNGKEIFGIDNVLKHDVELFGSGIKKADKKYLVNGGRILHVVGKSKTIIDARKNAYGAVSSLFVAGNNIHFRTDIGWRDVVRYYAKKKR